MNLGDRVLQENQEVSLFIDTIIIYNFILYSVANLRIIIITIWKYEGGGGGRGDRFRYRRGKRDRESQSRTSVLGRGPITFFW